MKSKIATLLTLALVRASLMIGTSPRSWVGFACASGIRMKRRNAERRIPLFNLAENEVSFSGSKTFLRKANLPFLSSGPARQGMGFVHEGHDCWRSYHAQLLR